MAVMLRINGGNLCGACHVQIRLNSLFGAFVKMLYPRLNVDPACPFCGNEEETSLHVIWKCKQAQRTWKYFFQDHWKDFKVALINCSSNMDLAWCTLELDPSFDLSVLWATAWLLWSNRNSLVMQNVEPNILSTVTKAKLWMEEWRNVRERGMPQPTRTRTHWTPPVAGIYKINFDGAISSTDSKGGMGSVIRNGSGDLMAAVSDCLDGASDSDHVEAAAALMAVNVANEIGLKDVILEGDSLRVIQAINREVEILSMILNVRLWFLILFLQFM